MTAPGNSRDAAFDAAEIARLAISLARNCGYAVFPCSAQKTPVRPKREGGDGYKDASTDPDVIAWLWRHWPGPLIGIATGAVSGISVLDVDVKHTPALAWWAENEPRVPLTRAFRTRSGGVHLYFQHRAGVTSTQGKICLGIDTRGDGGYAIHWFSAGLPCLDHRPLSRCPEWILDAIRPKPPAPAATPHRTFNAPRAIEGVLRTIERAAEGQRNGTLHWGACRLAERIAAGQIGTGEAEHMLLHAARQCGLADVEALPTIRSGLNRRAVA